MFQQRVALPDPERAADFLGDDDAAQIVHSAYNASCFPISSLLVGVEITVLLFVRHGDLYAAFLDFLICSAYNEHNSNRIHCTMIL